MNASKLDNSISLNHSSLNINFYTNDRTYNKIVEFDNNKYIKELLHAYELIRNLNFDQALTCFKSMMNDFQIANNNEKVSECLLNLGVITFYEGNISKSYYYLLESLKYFSISHLSNNLSTDLIYTRLLSNLIVVSIALNMSDSALEYNDRLIYLLKSQVNQNFKEILFNQAIKSLFFLPESFYSKLNLDSIFEKTEEIKNGSIFFTKIKSFSTIYIGFIKFLQNPKNQEYFMRCLKDSIVNLKLINDNSTLCLSLLSLSLMYIRNEDVKNSKIIALDAFKILKFNKNLENAYSKIINEQYQKYEVCSAVYESLNSFYKENIDNKNNSNLSESTFSKVSYIKFILLKVKQTVTTNVINDDISLMDEDFELLSKNIDFALSILEKREGDIEKIICNLQLDNIIQVYFNSISSNLSFIYNRETLKKTFKKFKISAFGQENIEKYREEKKNKILIPKLKRNNDKCFEVLDTGVKIIKFNYSSFGKQDKFIKYNKFDNMIWVSGSKSFNTKSLIKTDEIEEIIFGIDSSNLKKKFHQFKREVFKKPWHYLSILNNKKSLDFYVDGDEIVNKLFFSFVYLKENISANFKIDSRGGFLLKKFRLKLFYRVKKYFENNKNQKLIYFKQLIKFNLFEFYDYFLYVTWSLVRLINFCESHNLKIEDH